MIGKMLIALSLAVLVVSGCAAAHKTVPEDRGFPVAVPPSVQQAGVDELVQLASKDGRERLPALLRLRDLGDAQAVPALTNLLAKYLGTGNVTAYAAAQALFCIGTEQAHAALQKHLLSPDYSLDDSIRMAFHYRMRPDARDAFIRQYHLRSTLKDLQITLEVEPVPVEGRQRFRFTMTLRNASDHPLVVVAPATYTAAALLIEDSEGNFHAGFTSIRYKFATRYDELQPAGTLKATFDTEPTRIPEKTLRGAWPFAPIARDSIFLVSSDYALHLGAPGRFKVRALFHSEGRLARAMKENGTIPNLWYGTVVSEPVEIDVPPVGKPRGRIFMDLPPAQITTTNATEDVAAKQHSKYATLVRQYVAWTSPRRAYDMENPYRAEILEIGRGIVPVIVTEYRNVDARPLPLSIICILGELGSPAAFDLLAREYRLRPSEGTAISLGASLAPFQVDHLKEYFPEEQADVLRSLLRGIFGTERWKTVQDMPTARILDDLRTHIEEIRADCRRRSQPQLG